MVAGVGRSMCSSSGLACSSYRSFFSYRRRTTQCMYFPWPIASGATTYIDQGRLLRRKAQKLRKETGDDRWVAPIEKMQRSVAGTVLRSMYRPILLLTLEPMCLNLCIFSAILLGILYLFFGAFQLMFESVYGFSLWQRGLCFMGLFVGMVFAILSDPIWRRNYARLERNYQKTTNQSDEFQPEWRLPSGQHWHVAKMRAGTDFIPQRSWVDPWSQSGSSSLPGRSTRTCTGLYR